MFIKYQYVRNLFIGVVALGGITAIFHGCRGKNEPVQSDPPSRTVSSRKTPSPQAAKPVVPPSRLTPNQVEPSEAKSVETPRQKQSALLDPKLKRYRAAMRIAEGRADPSGKGKDVLGPGSPWKLNLYDDNKDGQWDRGKLDYERDEVYDEKWNFKQGRWEKDGGAKIWDGSNWIGTK